MMMMMMMNGKRLRVLHFLNTVTYFVPTRDGMIKAFLPRGCGISRRSAFVIELTKEEQAELAARFKEYTSSYREVMRAKIMLLASQGLGNDRIAARLGMPRQIVSKWRQRFYYGRLPGLDEKPRGGRQRAFKLSCVSMASPNQRRRISAVRLTLTRTSVF
jgi:hypothetical protein